MAEEETSLKFNSENEIRKRNIAIDQKIYRIILKPPEWLEGLESLFTWGLSIQSRELVTWNIPEKICDYNNQGAFYGFERLAFLLAMLFTKTLRKEKEKFWKDFEVSDEDEDGNDSEENSDSESEDIDDEYDPEKCYAKSVETIDEMAANLGDVMYNRIGPSLQHVLQATRAHMLFFHGNNVESQEMAKNIQSIEEMPQECKAGFEGLKAKVIMSMYQSYTVVLPYLHKAMELDPEFGYWPYLTGKVLRRARREFDEGSIEEELKYFEQAVSLERNPKFLVFLGQAYQEKAMSFKHSGGSLASVDQLKLAVELYSECWSLKKDSAAISRRVGSGMGKMRSDLINKTVAKEALLKAIELSPNCCTHINLGKFYYKHEMNDEKALEHFQQCHPGDFGTSEIIRLNLIKQPDYDPYDILQTWIELEENAVKQYRSFCDAAWYYLIFKRDVDKAAKYIWKVIVRDNETIRAKRALEFKSYGFCVERPVNLIEILVNEILLLIERNESLPIEDRKDWKELEGLLKKLLKKYPDLCNMNPKPNLIEDLKRAVDHNIAIKRRRRYGTGRNRSEPCRDMEQPTNWRSNQQLSTDNQESGEQNPNRQREGDHYRQFNWQGYANRNSGRSDTRNSFSGGDEERGGGGPRDDRRRSSESQSSWRNTRTTDRAGTSSQSEADNRFSHNRSRTDRKHDSYNSSRYDVTLSDWRSENRR